MPTKALELFRAHWQWFALAGLVVASFFAGRYSVPPFIQYRDREVSVAAQVIEVKREAQAVATADTHQRRALERIRVVYPDGTRVEHLREGSSLNLQSASQSGVSEATTRARVEYRDREVTKTVERSAPSWRVTAVAGVELRSILAPHIVYGGEISRRILGPVSVGAFGLSSGVGGIALSVEF
jgi:hypothetical protein